MGTWPSAAQTSGERDVSNAGGLLLAEGEIGRAHTFPVCAFRTQDLEDVDAAAAVGGLQDDCARMFC